MAGTSWPALVAGARARAADVELKFDWIEGNFVPMTGGSATDAAYDLGTSAARWRDGYFSRRVQIGEINTTGAGFFQGGFGDAHLCFDTNTSFTTTAVGIRAINSSNTSLVPLEIRASTIRITSGPLALPDTTTAVSEFSTDGTMAGNSDLAVPTEKAVRTYVDGFIAPAAGAFATVTSEIGSFGTTITSLSISSSGGYYEFIAQVNFSTISASGVVGNLMEIQRGIETIGTSLLGGAKANYNGAGSSVTSFQISIHTFASLTSGGHTISLVHNGGFSTPRYNFFIRRVAA